MVPLYHANDNELTNLDLSYLLAECCPVLRLAQEKDVVLMDLRGENLQWEPHVQA